jgi:hypothetical protein
MAISRSQMNRQLRMGGGIMDAMPRQQYGLGSFVKKAVKGVTGAVKGVAKGVKDFAKSDAGKLALLAAGGFYAGGGNLFGLQRAGMTGFSLGNLPGAAAVSNFFTPQNVAKKTVGDGFLKKNAGIIGVSLLGGVLGSLTPQEQEDLKVNRNVGALETKLRQAYENQRLFENDPEGLEKQIASDLSEYNQDMYRARAAYGGRIGYAFGSPEENAIQASGIMGLPLNQNPAGVTELDLRETGGFIPPVGVKEKADDIPAMLSNNEFVMTADAVREFGDGDVNKGAERMYAMMKKLENGGRV